MFTKSNFRILLSLTCLTLMIAIIIGCAAKKSFWGDEKTGFILNYQLKPDQVWNYQINSTENTNMEQMGQTIDIESNSMIKYTVRGNGLNEQKNLLSTITIDTINVVAKGMGGERTVDMSPFIGKSFGLTFSPKGDELEFSGVDTIVVDLGMTQGGKQTPRNSFRTVFPDLPDEPVKIGETWTDKDTTTVNQSGMKIDVTTDGKHKLEGYETVDGIECLKISSKTAGIMDGAGQTMGMDMNFEGDIDGKSTFYFAYKTGTFIKVITESFMEGTIAISGPTNMTMPITVESKSTINLLK